MAVSRIDLLVLWRHIPEAPVLADATNGNFRDGLAVMEDEPNKETQPATAVCTEKPT
jgi:hypothetical protein